jgi:hypothetical protein
VRPLESSESDFGAFFVSWSRVFRKIFRDDAFGVLSARERRLLLSSNLSAENCPALTSEVPRRKSRSGASSGFAPRQKNAATKERFSRRGDSFAYSTPFR